MKYCIQNITIVNEGQQFVGTILIKDGLFEKILTNSTDQSYEDYHVIDGTGKIALPGVIDTQVHFREPGLTHKATIESESAAAVAGGTTSFMEMPNTKPATTTIELLEQKYAIASKTSAANYSFFLGATEENLHELHKLDRTSNCGIKAFFGGAHSPLLLEHREYLHELFKNYPYHISMHCEDEKIVAANLAQAHDQYPESIPINQHPIVRSAEACFSASNYATQTAREHQARLHVLHLSSGKELALFQNDITMKKKKITVEACVHHLFFTDQDYDSRGSLIKWNPAIKTAADRDALRQAVNDDTIDIIATDHAPHTLEEKAWKYPDCPSGAPLVQHSLVMMLELYHQNIFSLEKIVQKMCHGPAELFDINKRGFIREAYHADLVLVDLDDPWQVTKENILYQCGWSPVEGNTFQSNVNTTFVNGQIVYQNNQVVQEVRGQRLTFNRT